MARTNKAWCFGFNIEQGIGPSENTGAAFPFTETDAGTVKIFDTNEQPRQLVYNLATGKWIEISTRDGPSTSRIWTDQAAVAGTGGTAVVPVVNSGEDRGNYEHYHITHKETHAYIRPISESVGLPAGLQIDLDIFVEGELTTPSASSDAIPETGDIKYDTVVEGHRLQTRLTANMGNHRISGIQTYYKAADRAESPTNKVMNEDTLQRELAITVLWASMKNGGMINRYTGEAISATFTATTGPDSRSEAFAYTAPITLPSVTLVGGGLFFWSQGTVALTIGGSAVSLSNHGASGSWSLYYANSVTKTGAVVLTPTGNAKLFDFRAFAASLSSAARTYYFNDIDGKSGNVVLPR